MFADEVLVIDDMSSDRTKEIAESLGAKVLQRALNGNWGEQQTFAMQNGFTAWMRMSGFPTGWQRKSAGWWQRMTGDMPIRQPG